MSRAPETGESTRSIHKRMDDQAQPRVLEFLKAGATLFRPTRLRNYYIDKGDGPTGPMLTAARVKKLEAQGVLRLVGVDRYGLNLDAK